MRIEFDNDNDYPKIVTVDCAICGQPVQIVIELEIGTPYPDGAKMAIPLDPVPVVLAGCEHFYKAES